MIKIDPIVSDLAVTPEIPSTVSINGVDYSPEDAQSLIELGTKTRDLEKQWDTPVDKVWPEYGKTRESLRAVESERDAARKELEDFRTKQNAGVETSTDIKEAQDAARKLGLSLNEDIEKQGYVKKEDLYKEFQTYSQQQAAVNDILTKADNLEKEIDGTDGRPAFNKKVVLAYANAYNIPDLQAAYEDMNKPQLDAWKTKQVTDKRNPGLKTLDAGGQKDVKKVEINKDNLSEHMKEALWGGNSE